MKIGNCNLPDSANVLGTEYKIYYETKENNPKMAGSKGYTELWCITFRFRKVI